MSILNIVTTPIYGCVIPSTKERVSFRPFLVSEERALLGAQDSEDVVTMVNTIGAVVRACIQPLSATENLTTFDIEYLFVRIRMKSIGEESLIEITCPVCATATPISIPLEKVEVYTDPEHNKIIKLTTTLAVKMRYPTLEEMTSTVVDGVDADDNKLKLVALSIETAFDGDSQYHAKEETRETMIKFVQKFTTAQYNKLANFFDTIPETRLTFDWVCPNCKTEHKKTLRGLNNFF
jgi:hypothetical protein